MTTTAHMLAENRQARFNYDILETIDTGILLQGWEVKAIRAGQANFTGSTAFVRFEEGQALLEALTVTPLPSSNQGLLRTCEPARARTLLLPKAVREKLAEKVKTKGVTVVPLAILDGRHFQVRLGLAKGRKLHDKRDAIRDRDLTREVDRQLKARQKT